MSINIGERYKQVFESHRHASDYRLKLLAGWGLGYAAFAAVFVWVQTEVQQLSWIVTLLGMGFTVVAWIADIRNRPAIRQAKNVGKAMEADSISGIPENQRFFSGLEKGISHSSTIDASAGIMLVLLAVASTYLFCINGELPS